MEAELKRVCEFEGATLWGMNGGPPAALVDNEHIVFRGSINKLSALGASMYILEKENMGLSLQRRATVQKAGGILSLFLKTFLIKIQGILRLTDVEFIFWSLPRDGRRICFNHPVSGDRTESCFVEMEACWNK